MIWGSRHRGERVIHAGERMTHMPLCQSRLDRQTVALSQYLAVEAVHWLMVHRFQHQISSGKINLKSLLPIQTDVLSLKILYVLYVLCGIIDGNDVMSPLSRLALELWHGNTVIRCHPTVSQHSLSLCSFTKCSHISCSFTISVAGRGLMISIPLVLV